MEGLRVLPWLQDKRRELQDPDALTCEPCQSANAPHLRQAMGCGLLPPIERPSDVPLSDKVRGLRTCPGYTTDLPDTLDIASCYLHWQQQSLALKLGGAGAAPALLDGLEVLHVAIENMKADKMRGGA